MKTLRIFFFFIALLVGIRCYSTIMANDMAHFSGIAYESQASIDGWKCGACSKYAVRNQKSFYSSSANIQGFGAYYTKEHAVVISFRGSVDIKNWIFNLDTAAVSYPACSGCQVHHGFYTAYKGIAPTVRTLVNNLLSLYSGAKIIITGHSLGGAMAILCALDMKEIHGKVDNVYTFGQPRIGNQNFANFYQAQVSSTFRVINYADMVPHVPPENFNFRHGGHEVWYNPRGMKTYKVCVSQDKSCADSISGTSMSTDDHNISNYESLATIQGLLKVFEETKNLRKVQQSLYTNQELIQMQAQKVQQIKQLLRIELEQRQKYVM